MTWVPRVALRPLPDRLRRSGSGLRSTRGYSPAPLWGWGVERVLWPRRGRGL
jgi:hypothetical protein